MTWLLSGLAFLLLLTLLVIVHEFGHYTAAILSKVTVEEFGFGMPPVARKLFTWKGTVFSLNWIPFGGFVRLQGEGSIDPNEHNREGSFAHASIFSRLMILGAGVFMNIIIALTLFTIGFSAWNWIPTYLDVDKLRAGEARGDIAVEWSVYIAEVINNKPAALAGVTGGGILTAVNGTPVTTVEQVKGIQATTRNIEYTMLYADNEEAAAAGEYTEERNFRFSLADGQAGVALMPLTRNITSPNRTLLQGGVLALRETWTVTVGTIDGISRLIESLTFEQAVPEDIAGIVGIAQLTHSSIQAGLMKYLRLVALLSLSLAVLNILPFPALDGGRMLFVFYELITRHPVNRRFEMVTNAIGITFIMALMIAVTWNDILRLIAS